MIAASTATKAAKSPPPTMRMVCWRLSIRQPLRDGADPSRAAGKLLSRWQESVPLFLLYRPRQMVLLSPQLEPASPPLLGDFIDLKALVRPPPQILNTALR